MESGKSEESALAICNAQFADGAAFRGGFRDEAVYDPTQKTAVSIRDGVLEYLGAELGLVPENQTFTVYRSPATIANASMRMVGIPVTDEHVELSAPAPEAGGKVIESAMIDATDEATKTTIATRNRLAITDTLAATVDAGKREMSLGYTADLVPHDLYDFEQKDIIPHHLAVVERGRCGAMCSFLDKLPNEKEGDMKRKLHKSFCDQEGNMNLQQIVELASALPEAIKVVPVDQLQELLPALQQIVEAAKGVTPAEEPEVEGPEEVITEPEMTGEDEDMPAKEEENKPSFSDADVKGFVDKAVKAHGAVIEKARDFLPEDYKFADKSTDQIMRDALATIRNENFTDAELPLAFKLMQQPAANYRDFGDRAGNTTKLAALADKEI